MVLVWGIDDYYDGRQSYDHDCTYKCLNVLHPFQPNELDNEIKEEVILVVSALSRDSRMNLTFAAKA